MGRRGSSSGMSLKNKKYGTEYKTLHEYENIKFVRYEGGNAKMPMETMSNNRIYGTINKQDALKALTFYDQENKRYKQIDIEGNPCIVNGKKELPHVHFGYNHDEKGTYTLSNSDLNIVVKALNAWYGRRENR